MIGADLPFHEGKARLFRDSSIKLGRTIYYHQNGGKLGKSAERVCLTSEYSSVNARYILTPLSEYMLWTDETAREFVKTFYPAHLHMYDSYKYPIQRADSIRYFVLHHFGGVYMDLDIGCRRRLDPLLQGDWDTILPITKPVSRMPILTYNQTR